MITDTQFFPSFFLAFPSLFLPRLPLAGDSKKVDVKSNSCSGCWQQQFGDLHRAGRVNKIHIYFLGSLSSFCLGLFSSRASGRQRSSQGWAPLENHLWIMPCPPSVLSVRRVCSKPGDSLVPWWSPGAYFSFLEQILNSIQRPAMAQSSAGRGSSEPGSRFGGSAEPCMCRRKARPWAGRQFPISKAEEGREAPGSRSQQPGRLRAAPLPGSTGQ